MLITPHLVGYWPFEGNANDASGNGNNGTVHGASLTTGKFGKCYSFDGVDDYIDCGNLGSFPTQGTLSFWMNSALLANYNNVLSTHNSGNIGIRFEESSNGRFEVYVGDDTGDFIFQAYIASGMSVDTWYHVVYVWDTVADTETGYLDGVQIFSSAHTLWPTTIPNFTVGCGWDSRYWNGLIGQVQIYNKAPSLSDIKRIMLGMHPLAMAA